MTDTPITPNIFDAQMKRAGNEWRLRWNSLIEASLDDDLCWEIRIKTDPGSTHVLCGGGESAERSCREMEALFAAFCMPRIQ